MAQGAYNQRLYIIYFSTSFLILGGLLRILFPDDESIKYIRFLTPVFMTLLLFDKNPLYQLRNNNISSFWKNLLLFYLILFFVTYISNVAFFSFGFTYRNFVNIILLLAPAYFFYILSIYADKNMIYKLLLFMFYAYSFIFFLEIFTGGISIQDMYDNITANIITDSDKKLESGTSLMFGFYSLLFLHEKKYKLFIFSILLTILAGKRIAIAGLIFCVFVFYYINRHDIILKLLNKKIIKVLFCAFLLLIIYAWLSFYSDEYGAIIYNIVGMDTDQFTMGRLFIGASFFESVPDKTNSLIGYGIGYVENVLYYKVGYEAPFHNDFLRIYLEFGIIFFVIWFWLMLKYVFVSPLAFSAFTLLFILIQTDNVLMYEYVMYSFYLTILYSHLYQKENRHKYSYHIRHQ
jgi:hypothetical protein